MPYLNKTQYQEYQTLKKQAEQAAENYHKERARQDAADRKYRQEIRDYCEQRRREGNPVTLGE